MTESSFPIVGALYESVYTGIRVRCTGKGIPRGWSGIFEGNKDGRTAIYYKVGEEVHSWNASQNNWLLVEPPPNKEKVNLYRKRECQHSP